VTKETAYDKSFLLLLFLIITKNTNEHFVILKKQMSRKKSVYSVSVPCRKCYKPNL
jgi:hypothetical protein